MKKREVSINPISNDSHEVELTGGQKALINSDDLWIVELLPRWQANRTNRYITYAVHDVWRNGSKRKLYLHRVVLASKLKLIREQTIEGIFEALSTLTGVTDHRNRDGLDNRRCNVRRATHSQNLANRVKRRGMNKYKGVRPIKSGKWVVKCRSKHFGTFATELEAAQKYNEAAKRIWGPFAVLNDLSCAA